jgi:hypothetical protein
VTIDIDVYKVNKDFIIRYARNQGKENPRAAIAMLAQTLMVPAIAVAYWIAEEYGYPEDIMKTVDGLVRFYGYTEIRNKPSGSPR